MRYGDSDFALSKVTNELCPSLFIQFHRQRDSQTPAPRLYTSLLFPSAVKFKQTPAQRCENYQCSAWFRQTMLNRLIGECRGTPGKRSKRSRKIRPSTGWGRETGLYGCIIVSITSSLFLFQTRAIRYVYHTATYQEGELASGGDSN